METIITNSIGMVMVLIQAGEFLMGSNIPPAKWDEMPVHKVTISQPFYISQTEVTIEQFRQFKSDFEGSSYFKPYVSGVSWYDAMAFCEWLSKKEGKLYRLPTEAEWEYVCKNAETNLWGIKNMLSGPKEWCLDWYGDYLADDQIDPIGAEFGIAKVVRGGGLDEGSSYSRPEDYIRPTNRAGIAPSFGYRTGSINDFGKHTIGFRIVQASMPQTKPSENHISYAQQGIKQNNIYVEQASDPNKPYFRKRYLLPTPPENSSRNDINSAGFHPSFMGHNHSPALEVCPNGDVLLVIYTSYHEYEPEVSLIASRLRFGAEEWDMPDRFVDFPNVNDHAPLLWNDNGILHLFWGNPKLKNAFPFQWTSSRDSGATWDEIKFPDFINKVGDHSRQPINTAFRNDKNTMFIASDAFGGSSVLWASDDNGKTWYDTEGRSAGRHTTYVLLKNGSILGMGGKNTDIDGFMPKAISKDGGKTWEVSKTDFCCLGANQRPSILRLKSGRLFFASDFQRIDGFQPKEIKQIGAFVALSEDEGETWHIKKLSGAQMHENPDVANTMKGETIGYSVARQAENGIIHIITTMNRPCLHFEMNEAWILSEETEIVSDDELMKSKATSISDVKTYEEKYPDGIIRIRYSAGIGDDGRYLLHGEETWFYPNGNKQREANYILGYKVGTETYWSKDGKKLWEWEYKEDGTSIWTQLDNNGQIKSQSVWHDFKCEN